MSFVHSFVIQYHCLDLNPDFLTVSPGLLSFLSKCCCARNLKPSGLKQVLTISQWLWLGNSGAARGEWFCLPVSGRTTVRVLIEAADFQQVSRAGELLSGSLHGNWQAFILGQLNLSLEMLQMAASFLHNKKSERDRRGEYEPKTEAVVSFITQSQVTHCILWSHNHSDKQCREPGPHGRCSGNEGVALRSGLS